MSNVPSAEKRNRQRIRRRQRNLSHLTKVRTFVKRVIAELPTGPEKTEKALKAAIKAIDRAAQKGVLKRETASRKISRLTKAVKAAKPAAK